MNVVVLGEILIPSLFLLVISRDLCCCNSA